LKAPKDLTDKVGTFRGHIWVREMSDKNARFLISKIGREDMLELLIVGKAHDKIRGLTTWADAEPQILRVINDPLFVSELKINGRDLLDLGMEQGKRMGWALEILLRTVMEDPKKNDKDTLSKIVEEVIAETL